MSFSPRSRRFVIGVLLVRAKKKNRLFFQNKSQVTNLPQRALLLILSCHGSQKSASGGLVVISLFLCVNKLILFHHLLAFNSV
jgi:hypothetical protein